MKRYILWFSLVALTCSSALAQTGTTPAKSENPPPAPPAMPAGAPMPPYTYQSGPRQGDWEAFVAGSGASIDKFDRNAIGVEGGIGYYVLSWLPITLRQNAAFDFGDERKDTWVGQTRLFVDAQFNRGGWFQPFIGIGGGYRYGKAVDEDWLVAPEGGVKMYVNESTFIQLRGEWDWKPDADENKGFEDGDMLYSIGAGFNF